MYTQCPDCKKTYPLGSAAVPGNNLLAYCSDCQKEFNALEFLSETPMDETENSNVDQTSKHGNGYKLKKSKIKKKHKSPIQPQSVDPTSVVLTPTLSQAQTQILVPETIVPLQPAEKPVAELYEREGSPLNDEQIQVALPWEIDDGKHFINWNVVAMLGIIFLFAQLVYFESGDLAQSAAYRPYLEKICQGIGCRVPDYKNLSEFEVIKGSFNESGEHTVTFKAVINNQSPFAQQLPDIKLTLLDYEEHVFAQRVFKPSEYLSAAVQKLSIACDESLEVKLSISSPKTPIGGYYFDLVY